MQLARLAAARALADWAAPENQSATAAPPSIPTAEPHPDRKTAPPEDPARPSSQRPTDPALIFTRLAATVRDCIALESRLAAAHTRGPLMLRADPRRAPLREVLHRATENHPGRAELRRETTSLLDDQLAADPDQIIPPADLLAAICDELGIAIDFATLPDDYLFAFSETTNPAKDAPDPRATSPP
jgi:hypothetical protein